jgi:hypothetical protein
MGAGWGGMNRAGKILRDDVLTGSLYSCPSVLKPVCIGGRAAI